MKRYHWLVQWTGIPFLSLSIGLGLLLFGGANSLIEAQTSNPLRVIESNLSHVVLELDVAGYDTRAFRLGNATFSILSIPGFGATNQAGNPQLPIKGAMVGIPPGAQATLRIIADQSTSSALATPPLPAPTPQVQTSPRQTLPRSTTNAYILNAAAYASTRLYPDGAARLAATGDWRSQHYVTVEFHPLQYNAAAHQLTFHTRVQVEIAFTYPRGPTVQALGGSVDEGPFESVLQSALVNYASARSWRTPRAAALRAPTPNSPVAGGTWFKLGVNADGMYKVTCGQLAEQNGGTLQVADSTTLQLLKQVFTTTVEYAINVVGSGWSNCSTGDTSNYIEFFGQANQPKAPNADTVYTNTNVYWLSFGTTAGKRMATRDGSGTGTVPTSFTNTVHLEQNLLYRPTAPMVEGTDHWYWTQFYNPIVSASYPVALTNVATSGPASLQIDLFGFSPGSHETVVSINSQQIADAHWVGPGEYSATFPVTQSILLSGANTLFVSEPTANTQLAFLNYFNLNYQNTSVATGDVLRFQQQISGTWEYHISNFSNSAIETFDITAPLTVTRFISTSITPASSPYTLKFVDGITTPHRYIALTAGQLMVPTVSKYVPPVPADLRNSSNSADYIALSYGAFLGSLQPLIDLRTSQYPGRVVKLDVQSVYDQFNDGVVDPQAIRDFLYFAYQNWQSPKPSFVLLVGDGTFDPKGYCSNSNTCPDGNGGFIVTPPNSTNLPPFLRMVDPFIGETAADNRFVSFNDNAPTNPTTLPQMSIGRLPANSAADVTAMVAKIVNLEQSTPPGSWRSRVSFVTGNAYDDTGTQDLAGNFWAQSDQVASNPQFMPQTLSAERIYFNPCDPSTYSYCKLPYPPYPTTASAESAIISAINAGRLIVNYTGHSDISAWASYTLGPLFTESDITALSNGNLTPVMLEMTCLTGYFIAPGLPSLAEVNLLRSNGGAVASWSATGEGVGELGHDLLDEGFFDAVINQNKRQIGLATDAGKAYLFVNSGGTNLDLLDTFLLLGDPATHLPIQFLTLKPYYLPFIKK